MGILTNDEAQDTFTRNYDFVQVRKSVSQKQNGARVKAAALLKEASMKLRNPKLAALAKVKENIDSMVAALKQESKDEIKDRDFCIAELNANEKATNEKYDTKGDLDTKIADLET